MEIYQREGGLVVAKFGGTSGATSEGNRRKLKLTDPASQRVIALVSSAAGCRFPGDVKITDNLISCANLASREQSFDLAWEPVAQRYETKGRELCLYGIFSELNRIYHGISQNRHNPDWTISQGDWLEAWVDAQYSGREFIDAAELIRIKADGLPDPLSYALIQARLLPNHQYAIPGFSGLDEYGQVKTFDRGGSDITGAVLAAALTAKIYENWTDVDGVFYPQSMTGQRRIIAELTYRQMGEWSRNGAKVLHHSVCDLLDGSSVVTRVRNTFNPQAPGTMIYTTIPRSTEGAGNLTDSIRQSVFPHEWR